MRIYNSYAEVEKDLKLLDLQRKIAYQELISVKNDFEEMTKPVAWLQSVFKISSKYGVLLLLKRLFKK